MNHPLQCRCGTLKGFVAHPRRTNRVICYCKDCQAFAYFLGRESEMLDERGGSEVIQTVPKNVRFAQGVETLACMRLTKIGLLRWYTTCCRTPIGATLATRQLSFIGISRACLEPTFDSFGPPDAVVHTKSARGEPKPRESGIGATIVWFIGKTLKARLNGDYKRSPLFNPATGAPIVQPRVLDSTERARLMEAVNAAAG